MLRYNTDMRVKKYITTDGEKHWQCTGCQQYFTVEAFYPNKRNLFTGITSRCKKCHNEQSVRTRDRALKNEANREYMSRLRKNEPTKLREREKLASRQRPKDEKRKARYLLNGAVSRGKIIKPTNCSKCGKIRKVTAHHPDYSKPYEVTWLCYECHSNH